MQTQHHPSDDAGIWWKSKPYPTKFRWNWSKKTVNSAGRRWGSSKRILPNGWWISPDDCGIIPHGRCHGGFRQTPAELIWRVGGFHWMRMEITHKSYQKQVKTHRPPPAGVEHLCQIRWTTADEWRNFSSIRWISMGKLNWTEGHQNPPASTGAGPFRWMTLEVLSASTGIPWMNTGCRRRTPPVAAWNFFLKIGKVLSELRI
ncbi:hypothetical protein B0H11DRAFT_1914938 [Mycena galericulata]|nr:hypothetical protein B0H11DRAFT_1914938 [Mycena galericulata]